MLKVICFSRYLLQQFLYCISFQQLTIFQNQSVNLSNFPKLLLVSSLSLLWNCTFAYLFPYLFTSSYLLINILIYMSLFRVFALLSLLYLINASCPSNCLQCSQFTQLCVICNTNYQMDVFGNCHENTIDKCTSYGPQQECLKCQPTFSLHDGFCQKSFDGCVNDGGNHVCFQCGFGTTLHQDKCVGTINCGTTEEVCSRCLEGFSLQGNICKHNQVGCAQIRNEDGACQKCLQGYFLSGYRCYQNKFFNERCYVLANEKSCLICKTGYNFLNGKCLLSTDKIISQPDHTNLISPTPTPPVVPIVPVIPLIQTSKEQIVLPQKIPFIKNVDTKGKSSSKSLKNDQNCRVFENSVCKKCFDRFYVGPDRKCVPVSPQCKTHNDAGECTACYIGYIVQAGKCVVSQPVDKNCKKFSDGVCFSCYSGFFLNKADGYCKKINQLCRSANNQTGACLSCYPGYSLVDGACKTFIADGNCKTFNKDGTCSICSSKYFLNDKKKCTPANPLCKQHDPISGACTSCYFGYKLSGIKCIVGFDIDNNCQKNDKLNCLSCIKGFYLQNNKCFQASPLCKTYDANNGACTSCYYGYELQTPNCVLARKRDKNCKKFDDQDQCLQCYAGFVSIKGSCIVHNPVCKTISQEDGGCDSCWQGYVLQEKNCLLDNGLSVSASSDPYCSKFNQGICSQCSQGYFLNAENICTQIDPLCKTSDQTNGQCLSCHIGYSLSKGKCQTAAVILISHCDTVTDGICNGCIEGYFLKNNECLKVPIQCATYNKQTGQCLSCIDQYFYQDGGCVFPGLFDQNCIYYQNAYCSKCSQKYYISSYTCLLKDENCLDFNNQTNTCESCVQKMVPQGPNCI